MYLELWILLPPPPKCWDDGDASRLGGISEGKDGIQVLNMPGKGSNSELCPSPRSWSLIEMQQGLLDSE